MAGSYGELKIADVLDDLGLPYEREYIFNDLVASSGKPLRFDFAVFEDDGSIMALIEYNGEQHYVADGRQGRTGFARQQYNDEQKVNYCKSKGYKLIVIPYWQYANITKENLFAALGMK